VKAEEVKKKNCPRPRLGTGETTKFLKGQKKEGTSRKWGWLRCGEERRRGKVAMFFRRGGDADEV